MGKSIVEKLSFKNIATILALIISVGVFLPSLALATDELLPPKNLEAHAGDNGTNLLIRLDWMPSGTQDIDGYRIYRYRSSIGRVLLEELAADVHHYIDERVDEGRRYDYFVYSVRDDSESRFGAATQTIASSGNHPPYFYPLANTTWAFPGEMVTIDVKGYDPDDPTGLINLNYSFDFPYDQTGAEFAYNEARDLYEFRWQAGLSEKGTYPVSFQIEDQSGLSAEQAVDIIIPEQENVIYIDGSLFYLANRVPNTGFLSSKFTVYTDFSYEETCDVIKLEGDLWDGWSGPAASVVGLLVGESHPGYIRKTDPSFIPSRDLQSRIGSLTIPIDPAEGMNLAIDGWRAIIAWLEKIPGSVSNEYVSRATMFGPGHHLEIVCNFNTKEPLNIRLGDISLDNINKAIDLVAAKPYNFGTRLGFKYYSSSEPHKLEETINGGYHRISFGGMLWDIWDSPSEIQDSLSVHSYFKKSEPPHYMDCRRDYFDESGNLIAYYDDREEAVLVFDSPQQRQLNVGIPAHDSIGTGELSHSLEATIDCHQVREWDGGVAYFSDSDAKNLLFHKRVYETPSSGYLPVSYEFGADVIPPNLSDSSFIVQLQNRPFDFPVKYADFRHTQNDWIEYFNLKLKPVTEPIIGQKSLRVYRTPTPEGVKYEYIEYLTSTESMNFFWDEEGNLIFSSGSPPEAEDFVITVEAGNPLGVIYLSQHAHDPEGQPLTYTVGNARHGTIRLYGNIAVYTPNDGYAGVDSFIYTATDPGGLSDNGKIIVLVLGEGFDASPPAIGEIRNTDPSRVSMDATGNIIYAEEVDYDFRHAINSDAEHYPGSIRFHIKDGVFENPPRHGDNPNPPEIRIIEKAVTGAKGEVVAYGAMELQYDGTYEAYGVIECSPSTSGEIAIEVIDNIGQVSGNKLYLRIDVVNNYPNAIHVPQDYRTIQEAIDHAVDGDAILVSPGTYEDNSINVSGKSISIIGEDKHTTIVSYTSSSLFGINSASNCLIKGLTIQAEGRTNFGVGWSSNIRIEDCIIQAGKTWHLRPPLGIWLEPGLNIESSSGIEIHNTIIIGSPSIRLSGSSGNIFKNNIFVTYDLTYDVMLSNSAWNVEIDHSCQSNSFINNVFFGDVLLNLDFPSSSRNIIGIIISAATDELVIESNIFRTINNDGGSTAILDRVESGHGDITVNYNFIPYPVISEHIIIDETNITDIASPLFVNESSNVSQMDFRLRAGSPCIDTGDPAPEYNDADGSRNDMGAYGGPGTPEFICVSQDYATTQEGIDSANSAEEGDFLTRIDSYEDFLNISIDADWHSNIARSTKFLVPARDLGMPPDYTTFQNVNRYPFHYQFLQLFRWRLILSMYNDLVLYRDSPPRQYYAGDLYEIHNDDEVFFGFVVYTAPGVEAELPEQEEVTFVYNEIRSLIDPSMEIRYTPFLPDHIRKAEKYEDTPFLIFPLESGTEYQGYSLNTNYGVVRCYTLEDFMLDLDNNLISWQDIIVVNIAPTDIEVIVAGVITGTPQGPLSHINIRATGRGTPNAYINEPLVVLAQYENQLVRLETGYDDYSIRPAGEEEAWAWWDSHRPKVDIPDPDDTYSQVLRCNDPAFDVDECTVRRFGGKGSNLARLYQVIERKHQSEAVFIPGHYYKEFISTVNMSLDPARDEPYYDVFKYRYGEYPSFPFEEYIRTFLNDSQFNTDLAFRDRVLECLRDKMEENMWSISDTLVQDIKTALAAEFGIDFTNVQEKDYLRFRSSSNMEDSLEFSGAGLYDSKGKFDTRGDRRRPDEAIREGLIDVWLSLWNLRAAEERMYYQIDQSKARMGVLITRGYSDKVGTEELARGVAFTFDSTYDGEGHAYEINVQYRGNEVALPDPGIYPEVDRIIIIDDAIAGIERIQSSSLPDAPAEILSDDELLELGGVMLEHIEGVTPQIEELYEFDYQGWSREQIAFDLEFKIRPDHALGPEDDPLLIKQIRQFLIPAPDSGLYIPASATADGIFKKERGLDAEHGLKAKIYFKAGNMDLPREPEFSADLIEKIEIIEDIYPATVREILPAGDGEFTMTTETVAMVTYYDYTYRQLFDDGGEELWITIDNISVSDDLEMDLVNFDADGLYEMTITDTEGRVYSPPASSALEEDIIDVTLDNGIRFVLHEKKQSGFYIGTVPAHLDSAQIYHHGGGQLRDVTDYWNLVYTASLHNKNPIYRFYFDMREIDIYEIIGIEYHRETGDIFGITSGMDLVSFGAGIVNRMPYFITEVGDIYTRTGEEINLTLQAEDPEGDMIYFEGSGIPDDAIYRDNGDGTADFIWTPAEAGVAEIDFKIYDDQHGSIIGDRDSTEIFILPAPVVADFTADPSSGEVPLEVQFTDMSTGDITSWYWSFGDGYYSFDQNPVHIYDSVGTFNVYLGVSGEESDDQDGTITVTFSGEIYEAHAGQEIVLYGDDIDLYAEASWFSFDNYGWLCNDGHGWYQEFMNRDLSLRRDSILRNSINTATTPAFMPGKQYSIKLRASRIISDAARVDRYSEPFTVIVARDGQDIQDDIDAASSWDTVPIEPGIYMLSSNDLLIKDNITLKATDPNPDNTVIILRDHHIITNGCSSPDGIIYVTIEGVTIKDYTGTSASGPIQNHAADLTLRNCKIMDNEGTMVSAIYNSRNSILHLDNTLIARNKNFPEVRQTTYVQTGYGSYVGYAYCGTIYLDTSSKLYVEDSTIADNTNEIDSFTIETGYGRQEIPIAYAAIYRYFANYLEVKNSILWNNESGKDISQRYSIGQGIDITNSDIEQESVIGEGTFDAIHINPEFDNIYVPQNPDPRLFSMGARF